MNRGNTEEARSRRAKAEADAMALLGALNSRGRLAPLSAGSIVQGKYRIERYLRGSELRNQYIATWDDYSEGRLCWECGYALNEHSRSTCEECNSELGPRQFTLSERWKVNYQLYHDFHEMGLFHPGLARLYDVFEESQRLFSVLEPIHGFSLADVGAPLPLQEVVEHLTRGCESLDLLHDNGIELAILNKDHLAIRNHQLLLHDLDISAIHPEQTPPELRKNDIGRLARLLREFLPADAAGLRAVFDEASEGAFSQSSDLVDRARAYVRNAPRTSSRVLMGGMSDVGRVRTLNEDCWGWERFNDDLAVYAVADGMGGHDSGEVASEMAIHTMLGATRRRLQGRTHLDEDILEHILDESFQEANNTVKGASEQLRTDMGTTLVSLIVYQNRLGFIANVGDSRAYLVRGAQLFQISEDHSLVANLVAMGKISKAAAKSHPHSNILVRTVGKEWDVEIDIFRQELMPGDAILMCSDGLWGEVDEQDLLELVQRQADPRLAVQELVHSANAHGGNDNVTALLVRIQ